MIFEMLVELTNRDHVSKDGRCAIRGSRDIAGGSYRIENTNPEDEGRLALAMIKRVKLPND